MSDLFRAASSVFTFAAILTAGHTALAQTQCQSCVDTAKSLRLPQTVITQSTSPGISPITLTYTPTTFTLSFSGMPAGLDLTNQSYLAWCADQFGDFTLNDSSTQYFAYSTYDAAHLPANAESPNWDKVNWLMNHKPGTSIFDSVVTQQVMWRLLEGQYNPDPSWQFSGWQPLADALYNQAVTLGGGFVPTTGQTVGVLLYTDGMYQYPPGATNNGQPNRVQEILIEAAMPNCGTGKIGDYVWQDTNSDGLQGTTELGVNGVTVTLKDLAGTVLATTTTATTPPGYSFLPPNTNGYYQFTGLCAGTYQVSVDTQQPALAGFIPTSSLQGGNTSIDSNTNPTTVTLPDNTSVDETLDFGFVAIAPLSATCAASTGQVGVPYNSSIAVTGGVGPYTFSISIGTLPPGLTLNPNTGAITGTPTTAGAFNFTVQVKDSTGLPAGTTTRNCSITIAPPPLTLACVSVTTGQVGTLYSSSLVATGGTAPYTYSIASGTLPPGLTLNPATGVISGTPTQAGTFNFIAKVIDSTSGTALTKTVDCSITIAPPPLTLACVSVTTGQVGTLYSSSLVATGGTAPYTYSIASGTLPPGLTLNPATGVISGTPTQAGTFNFTAKVIDSTSGTALTKTVNCSIKIAPPPLTLACVSVKTRQVGYGYSSSLVATGGIQPYSFSIASGTLPPGLTLNPATGVISGTATQAGTFNFTAKVTDSTSGTALTKTVDCSITISSPPNACGLTWGYWKNHPWPTTTLVLGDETYTEQQLKDLLSWPVRGDSSINLAHQLIAAKFNVLNGTNPATAGTSITDADNLLKQFSGKLPYGVSSSSYKGQQMVNVADKLEDFNSDGQLQPGCSTGGLPSTLTLACSEKTGTVGTMYSSSLVTSGGVAPFKFSITSGSLPPGLTLNTSTGAIYGTPTMAGTYTFTATVVDASGKTSGTKSVSCSIVISKAYSGISLTCPTTTGSVGVAYYSKLLVSGGVAPYVYSILSGSLPKGLTLNTSTGATTGTPTMAGTFSFTAKVVDSTGKTSGTATSNCSIKISPPSSGYPCLGRQDYWKDSYNSWPKKSVTIGSMKYNGDDRSMTIGGKRYSQAQVLSLLDIDDDTPDVTVASQTASQAAVSLLNISVGADHSAMFDFILATIDNLLAQTDPICFRSTCVDVPDQVKVMVRAWLDKLLD